MNLDKKILNYLNDLIIDKHYKGYELQIDKLLQTLDLRLYAASFKDSALSGCIFKDNDRFNIYVNSSHSMTRKRFTAIHEVGHYISAMCESFSKNQLLKGDGFEDYAISYRKDGDSSKAEREANEIAAKLLMPEHSVKTLLNQGLSIEEMSEKFYVSQQAMSIRLDRLGVHIL